MNTSSNPSPQPASNHSPIRRPGLSLAHRNQWRVDQDGAERQLATYERLMRCSWEETRHEAPAYFERLQFTVRHATGRVLEIGCGIGNVTRWLAAAPAVTEVTAVDAFAEALDRLRRFALPRVTPVLTALESLDLGAMKPFDTVVLCEVLEHIYPEEERAFLERLAPYIHPQTRFIVSTPIGWMEDPHHVRGFSEREFVGHLESHYGPVSKLDYTSGYSQVAVGKFREDETVSAPRVSVVLPTYNHLQLLPQAVASILAQTHNDFELIIVNDGSTDGTLEYLDTLEDPRVRVVHQTNQRLPKALNAGFQIARGELLTWTSADNYCAPIFLEALVAALDQYPAAGMAVGAFASVDAQDRLGDVTPAPDMTLRNVLRGNPGNAAFLYRRECQEAVGLYATDLEGAEDWEMWLRIGEKFATVRVPEILYYYRRHADSMTARQAAQIQTACGLAFRRTLDRLGGLDLAKLYPTLARCSDRPKAEAMALFDLGTLLLQSHVAPLELAINVLTEAFNRDARSEVLANLAVAFARKGYWAGVQQCLPHLLVATHKRVKEIVDALQARLATGQVPTNKDIKLFPVNRKGVELFELEQGIQPICAFTEQEIITTPKASEIMPPTTPVAPTPALATAPSLAAIEAQAREALAIDPHGVDALKLFASVCLHGARWLEAARAAARVLEQRPEDVESLLILAKSFFKTGDRESTRLALERVLAIEPQNAVARDNLADLGPSPSAARDHIRQLEGLIKYGQEAIGQGKVAEAIAHLEHALQLDQTDADLMVAVAGLQLVTGNIEAARRHLSKVLLLVPRHPEASNLLVELALSGEAAPMPAPAAAVLPQPVPSRLPASGAAPDVVFKETHELDYWKLQKEREGTLSNKHYEQYYTTHFGLDRAFFTGKRILDIGCGPRGSLEWANMAAERVGLDPLADQYLKLGADQHQMRYVAAPSESIPFPDNHFDVVTSYNSLDHVADLEQTIREIMRVVKPGGLFLLLTDVNHSATPCEPIEFSWDITQRFTGAFELIEQKQFEKPTRGGLYKGVTDAVPYDHAQGQKRYGILSAKFQKRAAVPQPVATGGDAPTGNQTAFAHLQRGFDLLKERQFAAAQAECRRYQEAIDYDALPRTDNRAEANPKVSVVIVAYKINEGLIQCLDSLAASTNPPHEIIVVDNGGNEAIHAELARRSILHIRVGFNVILAEGRNIGVHFARSNFAVFIDDDAIAAPGYLAAALEGFETFDVQAFRGKVLPKSDHPHNSRARHYNLGDLPFPADIDTEGNSAFRIDTWRKLGGQDPLLFGGEGVDLSCRISKVHGDLVLMYWPFMVIQHDYAVTDNKLETKSSRHVLMREYSVFKQPDLYTFHNKLVAFARSPETKAEGHQLLPRHAKRLPAASGDRPISKVGEPFFSICVPTYNRAEFIAETLASAFHQTHQNFEIVVVDDGSTDGTAEVMKRITDPRVRFIVKEHSGGPETRNRCIAEARGEFLVWLDSDDVLLPGTLELYAKTLCQHPDVDVLYGHLQVADEHLNVGERWVFRDYHGWGATLLGDTIVENRIPNVCTLVRKSCYATVGGYNPAFPRAHDYEFWTRLAPVATFKSVNTEVGIYRRHEQSLSKVRKEVNTSYEANAVKAMLAKHPLRSLFPFCYAAGSPEEAGAARVWLIATLLMVKYGDLPAALEFARRGEACAQLGLNVRIAGILQVITGQLKALPGPKAADEFGKLVELAARLFAAGQIQPCAQACAQLTELRPEAAETLLLVGLSLRRWANPQDAKTAFRCLVQRQCERAQVEAITAAESLRASATVDSHPLGKLLAPLFSEAMVPTPAIEHALSFIAEAAAAADIPRFLAARREGETPLLFALLGLHPEEVARCANAQVVGQIAKVRQALQPKPLSTSSRKPGYSFCIITAGRRPEKLAREIASIHALKLPAYEILVGGEVLNVPPNVRRIDLADAARAGRLGKMRNELGRQAQYDHLVVADDDLVFDPGFAAGLQRFGEGYDALAVRIINPDGSRFWDWATTGGTKGSVLLDYWDADPKVYITGGFCVLKAAVFDRVQWDEHRGFYEGEDVDFSTRLKAAGYTIRYNPFCTVVHDDDRYSRVGHRIYQFDHLMEAVLQAHWAGELDEVRRLYPHAVRMAGDHADRKQAVQAVAKQMNLPELLAEPAASRPVMSPDEVVARPVSKADGKLEINWQGSFLDYGSLSNINRVLTDTLVIQNGASIRRLQSAPVTGKLAKPLQAYRGKLASRGNPHAALTVRHSWPPDWSRPASGKLAVIQPWEFGALPKDWVKAAAHVDAFWVPSNYVRRVYVDSGVPAKKVHVLPNGIDPKVFTPDAKPLKLATRKTFKFLFVGGTIHRKGPDVLLKAYVETFTAKDDVCLVIKDFGGGSVYAGQTLEQQIREIQKHAHAPEILYLNQDLPPHELPGLYTACDCLAHPYRGEGFGLPVLEAMACGRPVIVTASGATDDFVPDEAGYKVPAKRQVFGREISGMSLVSDGWLLEPDADAVKWILRRAYANREEGQTKGKFASDHARKNWTWNHTADRLAELARECVATQPAAGGPSAEQRVAGSLPAVPVKSVQRKPAPPLMIALPAVAKLGHLGVARELLKRHQLIPAWNAALEALAVRPFHPEAYLLLAEIAGQAGDVKRSQKCVERARELAPNWTAARDFARRHPSRTPAGKTELPSLPSRNEPRVSVCVIAKNEERFLGPCLRSIRRIASQIVVVDTGSTDRTVAIAKEHGAEVHHFAWCDDFSAARNAALEKATGDWVLVLDADEELSGEGRDVLIKSLKATNTISWRLPIVDAGKEAEGCTYVPRLFRNAPGLFYISRVHEQVFSSVEVRREEWGMESGVGTAKLIHHGYTAEVLRDRNKVARNLRLLELAVEEIPGDPNLLMNFGLELIRSGRVDEGMRRYAEAFAAMESKPAAEVTPEVRESLLTQYTSHLMKFSRWQDIVGVLTSPVAQREDLSASLCFTLGLAHQELHQWTAARTQFRLCLERRNASSFYLVNQIILTGAPRHCLALACWQGGSIAEAAREFSAARAEDPGLLPLQMDAARFEADHGEPIAALKLFHGVVTAHPAAVDAWVRGARVALSDPDFIEFARDWTAEAIKHHPDNRELIAARGETLLLTQQYADALPFLRRLNGQPRALAARILCELMQDEFSLENPPAGEAEVSREFLGWYRRLVAYRAAEGVSAVGERLTILSPLLPSAARVLGQVLDQVAVEAA